jgi:hypothetical protein
MGKAADEIATVIDQTREDLKSNLEELETRVKAAADWREHFRRHSGPMVVAAMVGGALLSAMLGKRPPSRPV